ncbi:unnamed protein product [Paramecium octaurelia]|uniref:Uncharacterized protein n=1 Tax=Paramecium octaurelia TaxID=43137 RepID=A0A8S1XRS0_PAROT|nr:unnamed protein product [Paramecium octaurelia]
MSLYQIVTINEEIFRKQTIASCYSQQDVKSRKQKGIFHCHKKSIITVRYRRIKQILIALNV